jgi:hypothetical protein
MPPRHLRRNIAARQFFVLHPNLKANWTHWPVVAAGISLSVPRATAPASFQEQLKIVQTLVCGHHSNRPRGLSTSALEAAVSFLSCSTGYRLLWPGHRDSIATKAYIDGAACHLSQNSRVFVTVYLPQLSGENTPQTTTKRGVRCSSALAGPPDNAAIAHGRSPQKTSLH